MKKILLLLSVIIIGCQTNDCPQEINKLPLYGNKKKCEGQLEADRIYIEEMDAIFKGDRIKASKNEMIRGWSYFYSNHQDSAIMKFNQAWLLDSTNSEVYWGLGNILGQRHKFQESLDYFEKSLGLNPNNSNTWMSAASSYGQLFFQTKDKVFLDKTIKYLMKSVQIDPSNAKAFGELASSYCYFIQKDSAKKYLIITDSLNPSIIRPEVRKIITE